MTARYAGIMVSLPRLEPLFQAKITPISRVGLDKRLALLDPKDKEILAAVRGMILWDTAGIEASEQLVRQSVETLQRMALPPTVQALCKEALELRSTLAAMRMRAAGQSAPSLEASRKLFAPGVARRLVNRWSEPAFGLGRVYPWLTEADSQHRAGNAWAVEKLLLAWIWGRLEWYKTHHYYNVEAVVLYVLQWDMTRRRTMADAQKANARFEILLKNAMDKEPRYADAA
jgi:hypothetical protein